MTTDYRCHYCGAHLHFSDEIVGTVGFEGVRWYHHACWDDLRLMTKQDDQDADRRQEEQP